MFLKEMHLQKNKQADQKWTETFQNVNRPLGPQIYRIGKLALNDLYRKQFPVLFLVGAKGTLERERYPRDMS